eukprot:5993294-Pleurochrysis_carterae.AAC.2
MEEDSEGIPAVPVSFGADAADIPTASPSHELQLQEQAQEVLAEIDALLETSLSIRLDREAPFGSGKESSSVPLALSREVETQGTSCVCACSFPSSQFSRAWKGEKERARPHANAFWHLGRVASGILVILLVRIPYPALHTVFG